MDKRPLPGWTVSSVDEFLQRFKAKIHLHQNDTATSEAYVHAPTHARLSRTPGTEDGHTKTTTSCFSGGQQGRLLLLLLLLLKILLRTALWLSSRSLVSTRVNLQIPLSSCPKLSGDGPRRNQARETRAEKPGQETQKHSLNIVEELFKTFKAQSRKM